MVLHFFAKLSIFTAMELDFGRLPYKTSLEPEKHEKQGPEVRYRIFLDDLDFEKHLPKISTILLPNQQNPC